MTLFFFYMDYLLVFCVYPLRLKKKSCSLFLSSILTWRYFYRGKKVKKHCYQYIWLREIEQTLDDQILICEIVSIFHDISQNQCLFHINWKFLYFSNLRALSSILVILRIIRKIHHHHYYLALLLDNNSLYSLTTFSFYISLV